MTPLSPADSARLTELQQQCDECQKDIEAQSDSKLKDAMQRSCEECRNLRLMLPELMLLRLNASVLNGATEGAE